LYKKKLYLQIPTICDDNQNPTGITDTSHKKAHCELINRFSLQFKKQTLYVDELLAPFLAIEIFMSPGNFFGCRNRRGQASRRRDADGTRKKQRGGVTA
jgi:hypothetical protein